MRGKADKADTTFINYISDRRLFAVSVIVGILMGLMILLGIRYSRNELIYHTPGEFLMQLAGWSLCMCIAMWCLYAGLDFCGSKFMRKKAADCKNRRNRYFCLVRWFEWMVLSWCIYLPVFLAVYPGVYSYDASEQILQFYGTNPLTTHHPLIHTIYLGSCMKIGYHFFHSYQAGMALYSLSQSFFMSAVFSLCLCRMENRNAPKWLRFISWCFLVLNPYLTVFSFVTTKDVIFGGFFLLAFDSACVFAKNPELFWKKTNISERILFFGSAFFMILFRNQGIYVFLFFLILFCAFLRRKEYRKKRFLGMSIAVAVLAYMCSSFVPSVIGVEKGNAREMLCVPMQQLARVYNGVPEKLTQEEKDYIETLIDPNALKEYVRINADPVKSGFHTEVMMADKGKFLKTWMEIGKRMPGVYLDSFLMGNWGYWYPGDTQYWMDYILYDGAFLDYESNILYITRNSHFTALSDWLREITLTPKFQSVPVLAVILNQAFPFWMMIFASGMLIWKRRVYQIIPMTLLLGYWGTLLLGPVTSLRYALALIYCIPVLLEIILECVQSQESVSSHEPEKR